MEGTVLEPNGSETSGSKGTGMAALNSDWIAIG